MVEVPAGVNTTGEFIPFNRPMVTGGEVDLMARAISSGHTSAGGPFSERVAEVLREATSSSHVLLTTSCTAALEMAALLLDVGPGDTVVVPSFGFVTTAGAFARQGAKVLFCDIEREHWGLDPVHLASLMDPSVRAVVPIHYAGVACDLDAIDDVLSGWPRAELVEDNAHGLFGTYRDRPLGSFGRFSTLSFHETKSFVCGEGGALVINDAADLARAQVIYDKGTDRSAFQAGLVDRYSWQEVGSSFGLSDVLAAYLCAQLDARASTMARRSDIHQRYVDSMAPLVDRFGLTVMAGAEGRSQPHQMFPLLVPDASRRGAVLSDMAAHGVQAAFHYVPLHSSPGGRKVSAAEVECPVTDDVSARLIRLPFFNEITEADQDRVVEALAGALARA